MGGSIECYDIGGTNIRSAVITNPISPKILCIEHARTKGSKDALIEQINSVSAKFRKRFDNIEGMAIGLPGPVKDGVLLKSPPLHIEEKIDLRNEIDTPLPLFVDNDLNLATMAELALGVGKKFNNFFLLTISTGIGAGMVINKKVIGGECGEFGHDILENNESLANICSCGHIGCWVAMSSGYGIETNYRKLSGKSKDMMEICNLYKKGDQFAKSAIKKSVIYNAHGIGNMLNSFPMDAIVVMGSVGLNMFNDIIPNKNLIKKFTINNVPKILPTSLGENIGILGAFIFANENLSEKNDV